MAKPKADAEAKKKKKNEARIVVVVSDRVENIMGKRSNAGFQQCFQKPLPPPPHFVKSRDTVLWRVYFPERLNKKRGLVHVFGKMTLLFWKIVGIIINPFPNKPWFLRVCSTSLAKTLWEKEKLLVTSNFSFSHSVFYPFGWTFCHFHQIWNCRMLTLSVWKSLKFVV